MAPEDDFIEEEIEVEDDALYVMDRLVEEGWFKDRSDFMLYSVQRRNVELEDGFSVDPTLDYRITEIKEINRVVEDDFLRDFFVDTSYFMQNFARLANETEADAEMGRLQDYMAQEFIETLGATNLSREDASEFLDRTFEITDDFYNLSDVANGGYEGVIEDYESEYMEQDERLIDLLVDQ